MSGEEAEKFSRQVKYGRPKKAAVESAKRGKVMLKEFSTTGRVIIKATANLKAQVELNRTTRG